MQNVSMPKASRGSAKLREYRSKRSFDATPEPAGSRARRARTSRFVIQEHHARRLHWDLRIEHEGVLASWALPKGIPLDPKQNRLAVRTEDHPLEYIDFEGEIPAGQYGAGRMAIWDRGPCELEKFEDAKVIAVLGGERVAGRYALFRTKGENWMIHRMDAPVPGRQPMPERVEPMRATLAKRMPRDDDAHGYEIKWDGVRAIAYCRGGAVELQSRNMRDISAQYPEVRRMGRALGSREAVIDGELVAFDDEGRPSFQRLQGRMHVKSESTIRRLLRADAGDLRRLRPRSISTVRS